MSSIVQRGEQREKASDRAIRLPKRGSRIDNRARAANMSFRVYSSLHTQSGLMKRRHNRQLPCIFAMRLNENTAIIGSNVVLVPYR